MQRFTVLVLLVFLYAFTLTASEYVDYGKLHFETNAFTSNGSSLESDSVAIGFTPLGKEKFQPLLLVPGGFSMDTTAKTMSFRLNGPYRIIIADSKRTIVDAPDSASTTISIDSLLSAGAAVTDIRPQEVVGAVFNAGKLKLTNPDTNTTVNSIVEILGDLTFIDLPNFKLPIIPPFSIKCFNGFFNLDSFSITLKSDFQLKSASMVNAQLTVAFSMRDTSFSFFGNSDFQLNTDTFRVALGIGSEPGIKIKNGTANYIGFTLNDRFSINSLTMQGKNVCLLYDFDSTCYKIFGGPVSALVGPDTVSLDFYTKDNPGIIIRNGSVEKISAGLSGALKFGNALMTVDSLNFAWLRDSSEYVIYGGPSALTLPGGETFNVYLGYSPELAGLIIRKGKLKQLIAGVSSSFTIGGANIDANKLTFEYFPDSSKYALFGGPTGFTLAGGEKFAVSFGTGPENPGLVIKSGRLTQVILGVTSDFTIGGVKFNSDSLTFGYLPDSSKYMLYGGHDSGGWRKILGQLWKCEKAGCCH